MKKITFILTLFLCLALWQSNAQHTFATVTGPVNVAAGTPVTVNMNDAGNTAAVPAGVYDSFTITVDWDNPAGNPWSSEAELQVMTAAGQVADVDPPTAGGANSGDPATLTFSGTFSTNYEPGVDGLFDIVLGQSYTGSSADWSNIVVEIFEVPTCLEPTALMLDSNTATDAVVSWTNDPSATLGVEFEFGLSGFMPGTGNSVAAGGGVGASANAGDVLTPATDYDFYVRSNCDTNGFSEWAGPVSFTTDCVAFTPDYTESFDSGVPPTCWIEAGAGDPTTGPMDIGGGLWNHDDFRNVVVGSDNSAQINLYTNNREDWLISPVFDLSGGTYELVYTVALTDFANSNPPELNGMGTDDEVQVLITADGGASWINLVTYNQSSFPSDTGDTETFDLSAYTGNVQFAIWATDGTVDDTEDYDFFFDEFIVRTPLACTSAVVDSSTVAEDCANSQFYVDVDITTVGDATQINDGTDTFAIVGTGVLQVGPYPVGTTATLTVEHSDPACDFSLGGFTLAACPPANDNFADATAIDCSSGTIMGSTTLATLDEDDAPDGGGADMDAPNVWYSIDSSVDGASDVTLDLCGSSYDTSVLVYTGTSGNLTFVAANDDNVAACGQCCQSLVTFPTDGTSTYYVAVEGYNVGNTGDFEMLVSCVPATPAPGNDECANAVALTTGVPASGTTVGATTSPGDAPTCDTFGSIADVWYSYEITGGTSNLSITTTITGTSDQANVALYDDCGALAANSLGCSDANGGETLDVMNLATGIYYIRVWSDGNAPPVPPTTAGRTEGTFDIVVNATLSTGSIQEESSFTYYPNPVENTLTLNSQNTIENVNVYNMLGQEVLKITPNNLEGVVDMSSLANGAYFVKVTIANVTKTVKVIKQ